MKKVFLVGMEEDKEETLKFLQETGVLHVEPVAKMSGEVEKRNAANLHEARRVEQVYQSLNVLKTSQESIPAPGAGDLLAECEKALEELQDIKNRKKSLAKTLSDLSPWGDFDPSDMEDLEKEGIFVQRFRAEGMSLAEVSLPDDVYAEVVSEKPSLQFFTVSLGRPLDLPWATLLRHPEQGLEKTRVELDRCGEREAQLAERLATLSRRKGELKQRYLDLVTETNFTECLGTVYSEELLFGLQGWVPEDAENALLNRIAVSDLALVVNTRDPVEDEEPPILFKNNWFFRRIEPLLKLYGLPGYKDLDPSYFFAPFMILFFGICLGDAGYGLVFLLASVGIRKKFGHLSPALGPVMRLCEAFSISAILVGLLTGSVFGLWVFSREWIMVDLDKDYGDPMVLFYASLGLGVIHLSLSYLMGIMQSSSKMGQLHRLGLLGVLWGGSCLISQRIWFSDPSVVMHQVLFYGGTGFLGIGVLLTFLCASDSRKVLVRIGLGLWSVYGLTTLVGDLLSYARLFGLGIATTAIASVMNDLARMAHQGAGPIVGGIFGVLILILGHTFNLLLSILGSTVHSARLHFVEAFKSFFHNRGTEYKPFKVERG